jgi:hypothetical protein
MSTVFDLYKKRDEWWQEPWIEFEEAYARRLAQEGPTQEELHRAWLKYVEEQTKEGGTP